MELLLLFPNDLAPVVGNRHLPEYHQPVRYSFGLSAVS
jgi:hypothetical protein